MKQEDGCERFIGPYRCVNKPTLTWTRFGKDPIRLCSSCWVVEQKNFEYAQEERRSREAKTDSAGRVGP